MGMANSDDEAKIMRDREIVDKYRDLYPELDKPDLTDDERAQIEAHILDRAKQKR